MVGWWRDTHWQTLWAVGRQPGSAATPPPSGSSLLPLTPPLCAWRHTGDAATPGLASEPVCEEREGRGGMGGDAGHARGSHGRRPGTTRSSPESAAPPYVASLKRFRVFLFFLGVLR